jgi:hypothetical protein
MSPGLHKPPKGLYIRRKIVLIRFSLCAISVSRLCRSFASAAGCVRNSVGTATSGSDENICSCSGWGKQRPADQRAARRIWEALLCVIAAGTKSGGRS